MQPLQPLTASLSHPNFTLTRRARGGSLESRLAVSRCRQPALRHRSIGHCSATSLTSVCPCSSTPSSGSSASAILPAPRSHVTSTYARAIAQVCNAVARPPHAQLRRRLMRLTRALLCFLQFYCKKAMRRPTNLSSSPAGSHSHKCRPGSTSPLSRGRSSFRFRTRTTSASGSSHCTSHSKLSVLYLHGICW
jgi:hypothetical protein